MLSDRHSTYSLPPNSKKTTITATKKLKQMTKNSNNPAKKSRIFFVHRPNGFKEVQAAGIPTTTCMTFDSVT